MATTVRRDPITHEFPCRWILCYRDDFHGEIDAWLRDLLGQARRAGRDVDESWPTDLSGPEYVRSWPMPLMGMPQPGTDPRAAAKVSFLNAIQQPLTVQRPDGRLQYPVVFRDDGADRLADAFAEVRLKNPRAPLVPELQVVLGHLLNRAGWTPGAACIIDVARDPQALDDQIKHALATHLDAALINAFPVRQDEAAEEVARVSRARLLLALRELADSQGRRGGWLTRRELVDAIGPGGEQVLERLASSEMRLIVEGYRGRDRVCGLSHDRMAEVVTEYVNTEIAGGQLEFDRAVVALRRFVSQRSDLFRGRVDETACNLTREQHDRIAGAQKALLWTADHRAWWEASQRWFGVSQRLEQDPRSGFWALVELTRQPDVDWDRLVKRLASIRIDPGVFWEAPWPATGEQKPFGPDEVFSVVREVYPAWLDSAEVVRAMSHAIEESMRRHPESSKRAQVLRERLREGRNHEHGSMFRGDRWHLPDDEMFGFVQVPDGPFRMGSNRDEDPLADPDEVWPDTRDGQGLLHVPQFYMARYPVTVAQYRVFVEDTGHSAVPSLWRGLPEHPVSSVSWHEALAYCQWLEALFRETHTAPDSLRRCLSRGWHLTLPSEAEWEKAARGTDGRIYPWRNAIDPDRANYANTGLGRTSLVGAYPRGSSPYGTLDMSGNVWEWTRSLWGEDARETSYPYPYRPDDGRENLAAPDNVHRVMRGGSFSNAENFLRAAKRDWNYPYVRINYIGFRAVVSPFSSFDL